MISSYYKINVLIAVCLCVFKNELMLVFDWNHDSSVFWYLNDNTFSELQRFLMNKVDMSLPELQIQTEDDVTEREEEQMHTDT